MRELWKVTSVMCVIFYHGSTRNFGRETSKLNKDAKCLQTHSSPKACQTLLLLLLLLPLLLFILIIRLKSSCFCTSKLTCFPSNDHLPSSAQTDIVAVRTPQEGPHSFLSTRGPSPIDTSDSDCTKLGETPSPRRNQQTDCSPSPRSRSPRPSSLPGVGDNSSVAATPKRSLPRGSEVGVTLTFSLFWQWYIHSFS